MNTQTFMISLKFLPQYRRAIFEILPQERARADELHAQGIIEAIYLSADNTTVGWLIAHGESQASVEEVLATLPLYSHGYMEASLTPLADPVV